MACAAEVEFFIDKKALPSGEVIILVVINIRKITIIKTNTIEIVVVCGITPAIGLKVSAKKLIPSSPLVISANSVNNLAKISERPKVTIAR